MLDIFVNLIYFMHHFLRNKIPNVFFSPASNHCTQINVLKLVLNLMKTWEYLKESNSIKGDIY